MRLFLVAAAAVCCIGAAPPSPSSGDAGNRLIASFTACRAIADPGQRLACFDKATSGLENAVAQKDVTILDRQEIRATKKSLFGFTLPKFSIFGRADDGDAKETGKGREHAEFTQLDTTIASIRPFGYGKFEITLPDGAVWQTTEPLSDSPRAGMKIQINRALLGSYFVRIDGGHTVRGQRLR